MDRHGKTAQEFIQLTFPPMIAVLRSSKVDNVMSKNNLSFVELLQPFTTLDSEGQFREPNGTACVVKNWKLVFRDVNWKPVQPTEARRQLNNAVLRNYDEKNSTLESGGSKFNIPHSTPWFECWRETYFEVQFPSDHEFTKHFLSCLLVGTTLDEPIIDSFNALNQELNTFLSVTPPKLPKWFNNNILKSYVLLHDVSCVPKEKAESAFELMKQNFGAGNCFILHINSRSTTDQLLSADFWIPYIKHNTDVELLSPSSNWPNTPDNLSVNAMSPSEEDTPTINVMPQEASHPLTALEESSYDNANSLQSHSFSGSMESVSTVGKTFDLSTEVHGAALNSNDVETIKRFVQEYAFKALLPYIERQVTVLSEAVANRKGVSRSLLSATKRWFGGKAPTTTGNNTVVYSSECPELQLRRLGDLWFMCGQWHRAFDTYHTAKREFYADSAWLCYAGALEMAALSAFMAGEANPKTNAYMEESIVTYLNTCRMVQYAVRATLLSSLCLTASGFHGEAAKQLIRMTSEDSDLRSAMLLEQAAMCFISGPGSKAMARKYAFHMVLAGHRFSKAGQKKHAYRCYKHAYEVYENSGWRLATDHVQFALGRLATSLKQPQLAVGWLTAPLAPGSPQPPEQHLAFLRDYMLAYQQWRETVKEGGSLSSLPLPLVCRGGVSVCVRGPPPLAAAGRVRATDLPSRCWPMLEQMAVQVAKGNLPLIFTPTINQYSATDNNAHPVVPKREPIQISITIKNPLKVSLLLKDMELLWRFLSKEDPAKPTEWINNEEAIANGVSIEHNVIFGQKIKSLYLEGEKSETINFSLTPLQVGQLVVQGLAYRLISGGDENGESKNSISIYGKLDLEQASNPGTPIKCLDITVIPCAPCLQMTFSETSPEAISGEIRYIDVEFRNVGPVGLKNLHIAVSHPDSMHLHQPDQQDHLQALVQYKFTKPPTSAEESGRSSRWRSVSGRHVTRVCSGGVAGGGAVRARLLLRPRLNRDTLYLLAYYEPDHTHPAMTHRLVRHAFNFHVTESVEITAVPRRGVCVEHGAVKERMNIGVEVEHLGAAGALEVSEVALVGEQWALRRVHGAPGPLRPRHRAHLVLTAARHAPRRLHVSGLPVTAPAPPAPPLHLLPLSHFLVEHRTSLEDEEYVTRDPDHTPGLIHSQLVVRWTVRDARGDHHGHHCLWINCFGDDHRNEPLLGLGLSPTDDFENKTDLNSNMVIMTLDHEKHVKHDFEKNKLCVVPVTINIINCHNDPVEARFDFSKKSGAVGWVGVSEGEVRVGGVQGGAVRAGAVVSSPHCRPLSPAPLLANHPHPLTHTHTHDTLLHVHQHIST